MGNCPFRPLPLPESKGPNRRKWRTFLCVMHERGSLSGAGFIIPLIGATGSPARLLCELSNWTSLSRMGVFRTGSSVPRRHIQTAAVESGNVNITPMHNAVLRSRLQRWSLGR